jgi:hypothetical protein
VSEQLTCAGCGKRYWLNQAWIHSNCVKQSQSVSVKQKVANNAPVKLTERKTTAATFDRKSYMRDYMRKRRSAA